MSSLQKVQTSADCGNHDWRGSMANPRIQWCSKCRQRQMFNNGRWVRIPMSAPKSE